MSLLFLSEDRSLKLLFEKGYVGGLGASAFDCLHIGLGRGVAAMFLSDDLSESFTVCGFLLLR